MSGFSRAIKMVGLVTMIVILMVGSGSLRFAVGSAIVFPKNGITMNTSNFYTGYELSALSSGAMAVQSSWNVPTVTSCTAKGFAGVFIGISTGGHQDGIYTTLNCPGKGMTPQYSEFGEYKGTLFTLGTADVIGPRDKLSFSVSFSLSHSLKISLRDSTRGWTYTSSGLTDTTSPKGQEVFWIFTGPTNSLPLKFSPITFSGDKATLNGKTGTLGSFTSMSGFTVIYTTAYVDTTNGHILAMSSGLNSGTSFGVTYVRTQ